MCCDSRKLVLHLLLPLLSLLQPPVAQYRCLSLVFSCTSRPVFPPLLRTFVASPLYFLLLSPHPLCLLPSSLFAIWNGLIISRLPACLAQQDVQLQNAASWAALGAEEKDEPVAADAPATAAPAVPDSLWKEFQSKENEQQQREKERKEEEEKLRKERERTEAEVRADMERRQQAAKEAELAEQRQRAEAEEARARQREEMRKAEAESYENMEQEVDLDPTAHHGISMGMSMNFNNMAKNEAFADFLKNRGNDGEEAEEGEEEEEAEKQEKAPAAAVAEGDAEAAPGGPEAAAPGGSEAAAPGGPEAAAPAPAAEPMETEES